METNLWGETSYPRGVERKLRVESLYPEDSETTWGGESSYPDVAETIVGRHSLNGFGAVDDAVVAADGDVRHR